MRNYIVDSFIVSGTIWYCLTFINFAQAQIVTDTTLPNNSAVAPLDGMNRWKITEGTVAGNNLFHSFKQFSIPEGHTADFVNPNANIQNILVRVIGGNRSDIFGTLKTSGNGTPNLFLLNPHGILFGPNASLNVSGSFVATTANAIAFGNQGFFSASVPNNPALLTVNPSAFLFNQIVDSSITNQSTVGLSVPNGQSLLLLGSTVTIDNGSLLAPGGRIELGAVAGAGTVELNANNQNLRLSYPQNIARGNISIINGSSVNVRSNGGGSLTINARNIKIADSQLTGGLIGDGTQAGDIILNATEGINITQSSYITNSLGNFSLSATGNTGGIYIKARSLFLSDSFIKSDIGDILSSVTGNTKGIYIQAGSVSLNNSTISSDVGEILSSVTGNTEGIYIQAGSLSLNNSTISSDVGDILSSVIGNTEGIHIQAGSLSLNNSLVSSDINNGAMGNTSGIQILADSVSLNGTTFNSITSGQGSTNGVLVQANNFVLLTNSFINTSVSEISNSNASNIIIKARNLFLTDASSLDTSSSNKGFAGNILINAQNLSLDSRSSIRSETRGTGNPGLIEINADKLTVKNGAVISSRTIGSNAGGNINIIANTVDLTGGGQIVTSAFSSGNAGNITIEAKNGVSITGSDATFADRLAELGTQIIDIDNDGANSGLFARVRGDESTNAGNITVNARSLLLDNQGKITTETTAGEGGNINIRVKDIVLLRNNSNISANAGSSNAGGNGGNINIDTKFLIAVPSENSNISANAFNGRGGRVDVAAQSIFGIESRSRETDLSDITASSEFGVSGEVTITTPEVDPIQGLSELPTTIVDNSRLLVADCSKEDEDDNSQFIITGRGGLPANPYELLNGDVLWSDTRAREITTRQNSPITTKTPSVNQKSAIVPANGWVFNAAGEVTLISDAAGVADNPLKSNSYACPKQTAIN
ncbi:filamentous hemagglutinin N-terminal domain-containing protein [Nostoc sp. CHAB 5844]|nr:filamentous hemagglutinin N-terminal domain-containing protein [Nostoc sp. CHAB 5844]